MNKILFCIIRHVQQHAGLIGCETTREDRSYRWQLKDSGTDPYDGNILGRLGGVIADLAAILIR